MEFVEFTLLCVAVLLMIFKPEKERLAWWLTLGGYRIDDAGTLWLTVTSSDTASGIARTQALACLVLSGTALDGVSAVGLEDTDGDALNATQTANDLALTDPATDAQS